MTHSTEIGDLTLKQLLQIYQLSEDNHYTRLNSHKKNGSQNTGNVVEFSQLLTSKAEEAVAHSEPSEALSELKNIINLMENLIESIDSK